MHIYAYGSICRGEVLAGSDVDLLAAVDEPDPRFDPEIFSVYSHSRLRELWRDGNPFAWHLSLESRLLFAGDGCDFVANLGRPSPYRECISDCEKFRGLFVDATRSFKADRKTAVFDLSTAFLAIRNIATCYSLGVLSAPVFSRDAALKIGEDSLRPDPMGYHIFEMARTLCTRGFGAKPSEKQIEQAASEFDHVLLWMNRLVSKAKSLP